MDKIDHLLDRNIQWAQSVKELEPDFFNKLSLQQNPEYLWIGCSDSRVPANQIVSLPPGEIFVHRNIANLIIHTDLNCLSVIQYAIEILEVKHIIVCGHYGCGGIQASMSDTNNGLVDNWLRHIKDIYQTNESKFYGLTQAEQTDRLCEINVIQQVKNLCDSQIVKSAWSNSKKLAIHGWIYNINDGLIKDLAVSRCKD